MSRRIWIDRSRHLDFQRCSRLRWLAYHEGSAARGLAPVRKSIHLVLGGAVHAGLEVLLREGSSCIRSMLATDNLTTEEAIGEFFNSLAPRTIEDRAVAQALVELTKMTQHGVEVDDQERMDREQQQQQQGTIVGGPVSGQPVSATSFGSSEPMIEVSFDGPTKMSPVVQPQVFEIKFDLSGAAPLDSGNLLKQQLEASLGLNTEAPANATSDLDWEVPTAAAGSGNAQAPVDPDWASLQSITINDRANQDRAQGLDDYLREEMAAQVEGMVRAYARRRWRPLLEQFEVLEVEREGEWKLGAIGNDLGHHSFDCDVCRYCAININEVSLDQATDWECLAAAELWFMSRHDALLLERATGYLYLMSYKTTGSWDRRKEADAQVDMQGLSEAVDVEKRFREAWQIAAKWKALAQSQPTRDAATALADPEHPDMLRAAELVDIRVFEWLSTLPEPPKILGVRYEYLLKGQRRKDRKDALAPDRYVTDTPLIRAYQNPGLTAADRRWAPSYEWWDLVGKSKRLDYRAWSKAPVWKYMPIARWIDLLDRGEVQPESYDRDGKPVDILGEQFISPVTVFRNEDDMRDMLEQLAAIEEKVAVDVAVVQAARQDPVRFRSELNRRFPQNRRSCSYPGACAFKSLCYGPQHLRQNPETSELFQIRQSNHPQENSG